MALWCCLGMTEDVGASSRTVGPWWVEEGEGVETAVNQRTAPVTPELTAWETANGEFTAGRVLRLAFTAKTGEQVTVAVTLGWLRAWKRLPLTLTQRQTVRTACIQIANDTIHPCLGARRIAQEPVGGWMASPSPGVTLTWRPHWDDGEVPVMLTLDTF